MRMCSSGVYWSGKKIKQEAKNTKWNRKINGKQISQWDIKQGRHDVSILRRHLTRFECLKWAVWCGVKQKTALWFPSIFFIINVVNGPTKWNPQLNDTNSNEIKTPWIQLIRWETGHRSQCCASSHRVWPCIVSY